MKRNLALTLIVIIVITLSGCQLFSSDRAATTVDTEYHKGTQGIYMTFVKNNPPSLIYDFENTGRSGAVGSIGTGSGEVIVMIELRNKGAYPITNGNLYLSGFDNQIIQGLSSAARQFSIDGKSRFNSEGGFNVITLPTDGSAGSIILPRGVDNIQQNVIVHACYNYKTESAPVICIDPDPYREIGVKACRSTDMISGLAGGQGAPVVITRVEEEMAPGKVFLKIYVSNVGGGTVLNQATIGDCPYQVKYKDIGDVHYTVTANTLGGTARSTGTCEPKEKLKLIDGKGMIYCSFDAAITGSAYKTPLQIELTYGYMDSISKQFEIRSTSTSTT